MTVLEKFDLLCDDNRYQLIESELETGDVKNLECQLFIDYFTENQGYYKDKVFIEKWYLFTSFFQPGNDPERVLVELTDYVDESVVGDILDDFLYE